MPSTKCPDCGCTHFYVKDPGDQYNISEFEIIEGEIVYTGEEAEGGNLKVAEETETYCDKCAWHDRFNALK
jgi:RNase P subunit RPR2